MFARTFAIAAAAVALAAGTAAAQGERWTEYDRHNKRVWDGRQWIAIETVEQALHVLGTVDDINVARGPVGDIMDGTLLSLTEAERDDLADRLGALALADTTEDKRVADHVASILMHASAEGHAHSFDVLIHTHARAAALGHHDRVGLHGIAMADPERGRAYVLEVFEAAEVPPDCFRGGAWHRRGDTRPDCTSLPWDTTFCTAGDVLYGTHVRKRLKDPEVANQADGPQSDYEAVGLEPNAARWWDRCWGM